MSATKKTLKEALREANAPAPEFTQDEIRTARLINHLAQLMNGDRQAAALALIFGQLNTVIDGPHSINTHERGGQS